MNVQLLVSILVLLTLVLVFSKMVKSKLFQMNSVIELLHRLSHLLINKDLLDKPLRIKSQSIQQEQSMMLKDSLVENSMIKLFNMIKSIFLTKLSINKVDHIFQSQMSKDKLKFILHNKYQL
jgi:hypothetical protein